MVWKRILLKASVGDMFGSEAGAGFGGSSARVSWQTLIAVSGWCYPHLCRYKSCKRLTPFLTD